MVFEWDEKKNELNKKIHGISFEEAAIVFRDEKRIEKLDYKHSTFEEERIQVIGRIRNTIVVFVVSTIRNERMRIISARLAEKLEETEYYENYDAR